MARHPYHFEGGGELATMGSAWFVSYMYYDLIDKSHTNWMKVSTYRNRMSVYNRTSDYFAFWLNQIIDMSDARLETNTIGLSAEQIKDMASQLLNKF